MSIIDSSTCSAIFILPGLYIDFWFNIFNRSTNLPAYTFKLSYFAVGLHNVYQRYETCPL